MAAKTRFKYLFIESSNEVLRGHHRLKNTMGAFGKEHCFRMMYLRRSERKLLPVAHHHAKGCPINLIYSFNSLTCGSNAVNNRKIKFNKNAKKTILGLKSTTP